VFENAGDAKDVNITKMERLTVER